MLPQDTEPGVSDDSAKSGTGNPVKIKFALRIETIFPDIAAGPFCGGAVFRLFLFPSESIRHFRKGDPHPVKSRGKVRRQGAA